MKGTWCPSLVSDPQAQVKAWEKPPPIAQVRPTHCRWCHSASQPPGKPLVLVGHGVRQRQLQGPVRVEGPGRMVLVTLRRFLCRQCVRTMTVGPSLRQPQRLYSASALVLALALWGLCGLGSRAIQGLVSPWGASASGASWASLRRWAQAAVAGRLWPLPGVPLGPQGSLREQVARLVRQLVGETLGEQAQLVAHRAFCTVAGRR